MKTSQQPSTSTLLVSAALIRQKEKVLLTKRPAHKPHGGYWEFPGGKLEPGESPAQALMRELKEELDLTIEVGRISEALFHRYAQGPVLLLVYDCIIVSGLPHNIEVAEHRWISPAQLHRYKVLPADQPLINRLSTENLHKD